MLDSRRSSPAETGPSAVAVTGGGPSARHLLVAVALLVAAFAVPLGQAAPASASPPAPSASATADGNGVVPSHSTPTVDGTPGSDGGNGTAPNATLEVAYPDPVADGDRGEFVVVRLREPGNWTLRDGETAVRFGTTEPGRVALTPAPAAVRNRTDARVVRTPALSLANGGERLRLVSDGTVVDTLSYDAATEGELRLADGWRPLGLDPRSPVALGSATVTVFTLPDSPEVPAEALAGAEERLYLAGYTFGSRTVVDRLLAAAARGVDVRVLLEGDPVGGLDAREADLLDELVAGGVTVRVVAGPRAPFSYHHAKYAVADDRAVVLTENWKPSGSDGRGNRGWGVRAGAATAAELGALFRSDFEGPGTVSWRSFRRGRTFAAADPAASAADRRGEYPSEFAPTRVDAAGVRLLTAPGNARGAMVSLLDGADRRVAVLQPTLGGPRTPLVEAVVAAAARGVRVRVLLSGAWYVAEENRRLVAALNDLAERRDLPLTARVADPAGRYEKVHAKGLLVDDAVVVGSLNWNRHSATENREVALALRGAAPATYFRRAFDADWRASAPDDGPLTGAGGRLPLDLLAGAVGAAVIAALTLSRTVEFDAERTDSESEP